MGRPAIVNTEHILQAARELFLSQGFAVTTAAIARKAGISEGSIFKRFPTKEALFFAAMGIPEPAWADTLSARVGHGDLTTQLREVMLAIIEYFRELIPRITVVWSCRSLSFDAIGKNPGAPPLRILRALIDYLAAEARAGRLTLDNPEIAARMMLGSAHNYVFYAMIGNGSPLSAAEYAAGVCDLLLRGCQQPPAGP